MRSAAPGRKVPLFRVEAAGWRSTLAGENITAVSLIFMLGRAYPAEE
jgi:hypothetical protein